MTPITSGNARVSFDLFTATIDNELVDDISAYLVDGSITLNLDQAIKLTAEITVRSPSIITPYTDFLAPFLRIEYSDSRSDVYRQVGLFATRLPSGTAKQRGQVGTFSCEDLTRILSKSAFTDTHNIASGTNVRTAVASIISGAGISRINLPATTRTLSKDTSLHIQSSRLDGASDLLAGIGWYDLGTDLDGKVSTAGPVLDISQTHPFRTLTEADLRGDLVLQQTDIDIANVVEVINADATDTPLKAIARNDDADSPTSTANVGYEIGRYVQINGETTQADLNAMAARLLAESRSYYEVVQLQIEPDADALIHRQTVSLDFDGAWADWAGDYWVRTVRLGMKPSQAIMTLDLNRLTNSVSGVRL